MKTVAFSKLEEYSEKVMRRREMDDSIIRILNADKEAKKALEERTEQKVLLDKEFDLLKRNIDEANHAAYDIESKKIDQEREKQSVVLDAELMASYAQKREAIATLFENQTEEWIERLIKESMSDA